MNSHLTNDVIQILHLMNIKGFHLEIKPLNDDHTKENIYSNIIVTKDSEIVDVNQEAFMNAYSELWLEKLRTQRNKRLADADWVVIRATSTDTPVPEEWKAYMQALRDLPANTEDPTNPVWPVRPDEVVPVEETPVEETPTEETPTEETPVEETPTEETPVEETPVEETPVEETPTEETPTEETPTE